MDEDVVTVLVETLESPDTGIPDGLPVFVLVEPGRAEQRDGNRRPRRERDQDGDTGTPTPGKLLWTAAHFSDQQTVEGAYAMQSVLVNFIYEATFGEEALLRANEAERQRALQDERDRDP